MYKIYLYDGLIYFIFLQDPITGIINSTILCARFCSTMRRPAVVHICLAFCSLLFLNFATQCLAFPKMGRREIALVHEKRGQAERIDTDDLENNSITSKYTPQPVVSEDPVREVVGPSATAFNEVSSVNKETLSTGAGLMPPHSPSVDTATEPLVPAGKEVLSKAMVNDLIPATSVNVDEKEELFSSANVQPIVEGTTEATQGLLKYVDNQLFATESQGVSLGHSPSSYVNTKKIITTNPRTEKFEADTEHRTTSFPIAEPTAGTESGSLMLDREKPSQVTADNTQAIATKNELATSEYKLSVEPETDSLLGAPEVTVSVSPAVPAASVVSDEWDDTKLESVSQIKTPELEDNTATGMGMSQTAQVTDSGMEGMEGMEGGELLTDAAHTALGLPEGETHTEAALLIAPGDGRSSAISEQSSFSPTSLMEDMKVSVVNLFQSTTDFIEPTKENDAMLFLETTDSISQYESEAYQPLGNTFKGKRKEEKQTLFNLECFNLVLFF